MKRLQGLALVHSFFHDIQPDKAGNLEIGAVPQGLGHKTETVFYRAGPVAERNFIKILMNRGEIVHLLIVVEISQNAVVKPRLALGVRVGSPVAGQHRFYFRQGGAGLQHLGDHLGRNRIFLQNFAVLGDSGAIVADKAQFVGMRCEIPAEGRI